MLKLEFPVQIRHIHRLSNTTAGNPRYELVLDDMLSWCGVFKTRGNSAFSLLIGNKDMREGSWVYVTFTDKQVIKDLVPADPPSYAPQVQYVDLSSTEADPMQAQRRGL